MPCQRPRLQRADRCPERLRRKTVGFFSSHKNLGFSCCLTFFSMNQIEIYIFEYEQSFILNRLPTHNLCVLHSRPCFLLKPRWCTWAQPPTATMAMAQPSTETPALRFESGAPAPISTEFRGRIKYPRVFLDSFERFFEFKKSGFLIRVTTCCEG